MDKDNIGELRDELHELLDKFMDKIGVDKEMIERIERVSEAQYKIGQIIMELEPNEAAQVVVGALVSVVVSYSDSLDEAISTLARIQLGALKMIHAVDEDKAAPWNREDQPDDFPVDHKTKQ